MIWYMFYSDTWHSSITIFSYSNWYKDCLSCYVQIDAAFMGKASEYQLYSSQTGAMQLTFYRSNMQTFLTLFFEV